MSTPDLPLRFLVRSCDETGYGVWDSVVNAWRSTGQTRAQAERQAADLELQFDAWGPRPASSIRAIQPAVPVDNADWHPAGLLDHWIRARVDQSLVPRFAWYGRVRDRSGGYRWLQAYTLRRSGPQHGGTRT